MSKIFITFFKWQISPTLDIVYDLAEENHVYQ